jgi:hypothetical protein
MKIAIIESHNYHLQYVKVLIEVFKGYKIDLYLNREHILNLKKNLRNKEINYFEIYNYDNFLSILRLVKTINKNNYDKIFINTIPLKGKLRYYLPIFIKNKNIIVTLHQLNSVLLKLKHMNFIPIGEYFTLVMNKVLLMKAYGINVLSENLKNNLINYRIKQKIFTIPFELYENKIYKSQDTIKLTRFVIPGEVSQIRRDYETIYEAFKNLNIKNIELYLLGKLRKDSVEFLNKMIKLRNIKIFYYEDFVEDLEFQRVMAISDYIINPIVKVFKQGRISEYYGETKESGATFLSIKYGLKIIIPDYILPMKEIEEITIQYNNSLSLAEIITDLCTYNKNFTSESYEKILLNFTSNSILKSFNEIDEKTKK